MNYKHNPALTSNARSLRKQMTKEERHLWYDFLRQYPIRFLRQKVIGDYIVDFYCSAAKLVVELDGSQHIETAAIAYDTARTQALENRGLTVLRFANNQINAEFDAVCEAIDLAVKESLRPR